MVTKIWPEVSGQYTCPVCKKAAAPTTLVFQGIHVLTACRCTKCSSSFFHTLPSGHDVIFPIAFTTDHKTSVYNKNATRWLAMPLLESMNSPKEDARVSRVIHTGNVQKKAILINCLDTCFGHVFTKLCNITICRKEYPDYHIIALIPASMFWLLPGSLDEAWLVDAPLAIMKNQLKELDAFVKNELVRFDEVLLHSTPIYVDMGKVDFEDYLKHAPFPLRNFTRTPYTITFITREDRFWHPWKVEEMFFLACIKWKLLPYFRPYFCYRQNRLIRKTAQEILSMTKNVHFQIAGLGTTGNVGRNIMDMRKETLTENDEHEWMNLYAKSHIVIGVHGSNMIIPSILAAGFIEILPEYKIDHMAEDTMKPYNNRLTQFLCRHVPGQTSPRLVARHATSMLSKFSLIGETQR